MALLGREVALYVLIPLSLIAISADIVRAYNKPFARFIKMIFGFMMRADEWSPDKPRIIFNGATWVLITGALLTLIFPLHIAVASFTMFMVADAAAALIGRTFGRHTWGGGPRTIEGTFAFIGVGTLVILPFGSIPPLSGIGAVIASALAEAYPGPFNDNILVPHVAATFLWLLEVL